MAITVAFVLSLISSESVRSLVEQALTMLPEYWWAIPASTSGKYHPKFSLGKGGLLRHSILVAYFAARIADAWGCTAYERDIAIAAGLLHDGLKAGYPMEGAELHTVHEHPVLMAQFIRENFPGEDGEAIADVIATHMGRWTTSKKSNVVLEEPETKLQKLLSAADMCAATKELGFHFGPSIFKRIINKILSWFK